MADEEKREIKVTPKKNNLVQRMVDNINSGMDRLYKSTYLSTPMNNRDLANVKNDFNKKLDSIIDGNIKSNGEPNLSKLYNATIGSGKKDSNKTSDKLQELLQDDKITDGLISDFIQNNRYEEKDAEIDLILKFMPKLRDALNAKKDNVLSADNYSRDYINVTDIENIDNFEQNINNIKDMYNVLDISENSYDDTSKYGEKFVYIDNYNSALGLLLKNKPNLTNFNGEPMEEQTFKSEDIVCEAFNYTDIAEEVGLKLNKDFYELNNEAENIYVEFNSCCLESAVMEKYVAEQSKYKVDKETIKMTKSTDVKQLDFEGLDPTSQDGLHMGRKSNTNDGQKINLNGSIVKVIEARKDVLPIYIDNLCIGYYYLECKIDERTKEMYMAKNSWNMFGQISNTNREFDTLQQEQRRDTMLKALSNRLSTFIDKSFINAHKDLKQEIYIVLRHNNLFNGANIRNIKVTFIPPEKMIHFNFKLDELTHRGISDLEDSLLPAKIYVYLYLYSTIANLRSQDKRIYNIRQSVDTNIAANLTNAIAQIQKGNMGARELTSMKTMLNITGRFNDLIIPVGPSGESPINFEVMDGMRPETPTELMEMMEEQAIDPIVPYEYVQSRKQVDFAIRLTMSSGKFLRQTFKRQAIWERHLSRLMTILYNNEYTSENETPVKIEVKLPPPGFLQLINNNQLFESVNQQTEAILNMEYDDNTPTGLRKLVDSKLKRHYLKGYLDYEAIEKIKEEAELEWTKNKTDEENGGGY